MTKPIRTRFAPSPTGFLHIGSLRTVLFAYLIAKKSKGKFILRVEDTDQKRKVEGALEKMVEIVDWLGLKFDEGPGIVQEKDEDVGEYGPYIQSKRRKIYDKYKEKLIEQDGAYYCFCTPERLTEMREEQQKKKLPPRYDKCCRELTEKQTAKKIKNGESYVIRQKMPLSGEVLVQDELRGEIKFESEELDDQVLIKSDGMPTYQFAVVVDDHLMKIDLVIRGEEWIPSFPKNILLYQAFGWKPPTFLHMALTLNKEGGKLSKRQGDVSVEDFKKTGYLKEALINFNALLGWSPYAKDSRDKQTSKKGAEIFSLEELIDKFEIKDMGTSPAVFDIDKLDYFNGYYIRRMAIEKLVKMCMPYLELNKKFDKEYIKKVVGVEQERLKKLSDIKELTDFFFKDKLEYDTNLLVWKKLDLKTIKNNLEKVVELLDKIPDENWTNDSIEDALITWLKAKEFKVGDYLWPMRVALTGKKASPGPFEVAEVLGKETTFKRINDAINKIT